MKTEEFEAFVERNATKPHMQGIDGVALALAGEVGELLGELKKEIDGKHTGDAVYSELGDVLHYVARLAAMKDTSLTNLMRFNVEKLKARGAK